MRFNQRNNIGFSIVELLVIIVVIAILAALTIVSYNWVRIQAIETSMKSELQGAESALMILKGASKNYPISANEANNGNGFKTSGNNEVVYIGGSKDFCLLIRNTTVNKTYYVSSSNRSPIVGSCGPFVGTIAGTGARYSGAGYADGTGSEARFRSPQGIAIDSSDNMYIADQNNYRIRKMTPSGVVTTYAGTGGSGNINGPVATAELGSINSVAVDAAGNVYVTDGSYHSIRKITPAGIVSTVAGGGVSGYVDANGTAARFSNPQGIDVDASGNIYVADANNRRIRKITPSGDVTTFAGSGTNAQTDGTGTAAAFATPNDIVVDASGNLFVTENNSVRKVTPGQVVTTIAGTVGYGQVDGNGSTARFDWPSGIALDKKTGNLYVVDKSSGQIRKVTQSGNVTTLAGLVYEWNGTDGPGASASFAWPEDIVIASNGMLFITDSDNDKIRMMIE